LNTLAHANQTAPAANRTGLRHGLAYAAVAGVFALLMMMIPWESLSSRGYFIDRAVYTEYFLYGESRLDWGSYTSPSDYITGEWLWHWSIGYLVNDLAVPIDFIFGFISFLCLFTFAYFLASHGSIWAVPLLVNPLIVTLAFSQLRIALAFSLLLAAYMSGRKIVLALAIPLTGMIHTGAVLMTAIGASVWLIKRTLVDRSAHYVVIFAALFFVGIAVAVSTGTAGEVVLGYFGDRRATRYTGGEGTMGIRFTLFWAGILTLTAFQGRKFVENRVNAFALVVLAFVLSSFVFGGYTSRILAISLPLVLVAVVNFRPPNKPPGSASLYLFWPAALVYVAQYHLATCRAEIK
jgi:hypothetical protein